MPSSLGILFSPSLVTSWVEMHLHEGPYQGHSIIMMEGWKGKQEKKNSTGRDWSPWPSCLVGQRYMCCFATTAHSYSRCLPGLLSLHEEPLRLLQPGHEVWTLQATDLRQMLGKGEKSIYSMVCTHGCRFQSWIFYVFILPPFSPSFASKRSS